MLYNLFENRDFVSVFAVALLAEGVDRNINDFINHLSCTRSPSSRRAWIEMSLACMATWAAQVALLAEGVDRNKTRPLYLHQNEVALLAEGVDRNVPVLLPAVVASGRPPRGGRG